MSNTNTNPYSYHTFIFPFLFKDGSRNVSREDFRKCLHEKFEEECFPNSLKKKALNELDTQEYARFHYFNQAARNTIYMTERNSDAVVWNYQLNIEAMCAEIDSEIPSTDDTKNPQPPKKISFLIERDRLRNYDVESFRAELEVNRIRAKLFETGVGMLIFELENHALQTERDIIKINEYGRRVFRPYIKTDHRDKVGNLVTDCALCASRIELRYGTDVLCGGEIGASNVDNTKEIPISPIIRDLLTGEEGRITTVIDFNSQKLDRDEFRIEPIIDERMFVACMYRNPWMMESLCKWDPEEKEYRYVSDAITKKLSSDNNAARRFYEMAFIDGDGLTCQNKSMLFEMNKHHSYARWIEYGTLSSITEYSMVCISSDPPAYTVDAFLMEYIEMAIIVLAQRASLLAFERAISEIACKRTKNLKIQMIHREYISFESKLLLSEVTSQQQGIELYDMMLDRMLINKLRQEINDQINSSYELDTSNHEKSENTILFALAVLGVIEVITALQNIIFGDITTVVLVWVFLGLGFVLMLPMIIKMLPSGVWKFFLSLWKNIKSRWRNRRKR